MSNINNAVSDINMGLEGIVVGATAISNVEGDIGRLSYRGHSIDELTSQPFCQVVWLLLFGESPSAQQEQQLAHYLKAHRALSRAEANILEHVPVDTHPMLMLQGMVPLLELEERADLALPIDHIDARDGLIIAARMPTLIAAFYNRQCGRLWPGSGHSIEPHRAFLKSMHAKEPDKKAVTVLDAVQILQMEHSYNAGTFAGRVALSTATPVAASISASLGTLFGRLHGGADQAALEVAQQIGSPELAAKAVEKILAAGGRIMGMGHREYRTVDPRATALKPMARELCQDAESARLLATLEAIEAATIDQVGKPGIRANVEFYKGAVFHALGIPSQYFTALFAMARVYGYIAHALEYRPQSRLIRPRALYIGD